MQARRVLILGGTAEAAQLAARLDADPNFDPITSLAGRTRSPAFLPGTVRIGGFGGVEGLERYLSAEAIDALIDVTHPFAARISRNAADACRHMAVPWLRLERPPWRRRPGDEWIEVADSNEAAHSLAGYARRVLLSIGRQELAPFEALTDIWFLLRMIDPLPAPPSLAHHEIVLGRGPFDTDAEAALLTEHRIDAVVSKNSGGNATYGKIAAARRLGLPVIMIARPSPLAGDSVETVDAAMKWLAAGPIRPIDGSSGEWN